MKIPCIKSNTNHLFSLFLVILFFVPPVSGFAQTLYTLTDLGNLGGNYVDAKAINDNGQAVGFGETSPGFSGSNHAFFWEYGMIADLGTIGGNQSFAHGVNSTASVVGDTETDSEATHAFLWANNTMIDLGTLGGENSYARGINKSGQVVGTSDSESGTWSVFLWESGVMKDLALPGIAFTLALHKNIR
jgi:probable HAF family extracellular repeat protein